MPTDVNDNKDVAMQSVPAIRPGYATVLVVEDEPALLSLLDTLLTHHGFDVLCASGVADADKLIAANRGQISFLLCDVNLSDGSGVALAQRLWQQNKIDTILITGEPDAKTIFEQLDFPALGYFEKPFRVKEIASMMQENMINLVRS